MTMLARQLGQGLISVSETAGGGAAEGSAAGIWNCAGHFGHFPVFPALSSPTVNTVEQPGQANRIIQDPFKCWSEPFFGADLISLYEFRIRLGQINNPFHNGDNFHEAASSECKD